MQDQSLLSREAFKRDVFARRRGACIHCGAPAVDAHHILDRKLFADGGYYLGNGAALCAPCHLHAEMTLLGVEDIRATCGITAPVLQPGFLPDHRHDKWGNRIMEDGQRLPGPMFGDDGARKILARAGLLYTVFASVEA